MAPEPQLVVGAAIVRGGALLAARRTGPSESAGGWEFPGGKVEPGETPDEAIVREVAEELGCTVVVTGWLDPTVPIGDALALRVATTRLVDGEPEPVDPGSGRGPGHDAVRWLGVDELDDVAWLPADRPFLPEVDALLRELDRRLRAVFFEEDDARTVAARLGSEGWDAEVVRERLHGEDDDEDHPWAVLTDAPELVVELLVDEYDGWLDLGDLPLSPPAPSSSEAAAAPSAPPPGAAAPELPTAPRRLKKEPPSGAGGTRPPQ